MLLDRLPERAALSELLDGAQAHPAPNWEAQ